MVEGSRLLTLGDLGNCLGIKTEIKVGITARLYSTPYLKLANSAVSSCKQNRLLVVSQHKTFVDGRMWYLGILGIYIIMFVLS